MGLVNLKLKVPGPEGDVVVPGELEFEPSARLAVDDYVLLPERFSVRVESGDETVTLAETGPSWCWHVIERFDGGAERWVIVGPGEVDYRDLVDVDPDTLEPTAEPDAAWWALVGELDTDLRDQVVGGAVVGDDLVMTRKSGATVVAGNVRGPQGPPGRVEVGYAATDQPFSTASVYTVATGLIPTLVSPILGDGRPVVIEASFPGVYSSSAALREVIPFVTMATGAGADTPLIARAIRSADTDRGPAVLYRERVVLAAGVTYTFKAGIFGSTAGVSNMACGPLDKCFLSVVTE